MGKARFWQGGVEMGSMTSVEALKNILSRYQVRSEFVASDGDSSEWRPEPKELEGLSALIGRPILEEDLCFSVDGPRSPYYRLPPSVVSEVRDSDLERRLAEANHRITELDERIQLLAYADECKGRQILEFSEEINQRGARLIELDRQLAKSQERERKLEEALRIIVEEGVDVMNEFLAQASAEEPSPGRSFRAIFQAAQARAEEKPE